MNIPISVLGITLATLGTLLNQLVVITPATTTDDTTYIQEEEELEINEAIFRPCYCETRLHHYAPDGTVIRGAVNPADVGICQINGTYHRSTAANLDWDISTLSGNLAYADYLYQRNGYRDWSWSYDPVKDQCKNSIKLPPKDSPQWREIISRYLQSRDASK